MEQASAAEDIPYCDPLTEGSQEKALEVELQRMADKLEQLKKRCEHLRTENEALQTESHDIRVESHEYMSYIDKKTKRRQNMIVTQNDKNLKDLDDNARDQSEMLARYDRQKAELKETILTREKELANVHQDLADLAGLKTIRECQELEMVTIQGQMERTQEECAQKQYTMKGNYFKTRGEFEAEAHAKVEKMEHEANHEATVRLGVHTKRVRRENAKLRTELFKLVAECHELDTRKLSLDDEEGRLQADIAAQRSLDYYRHGTPELREKTELERLEERIAFAKFRATPLGLAKKYMKPS